MSNFRVSGERVQSSPDGAGGYSLEIIPNRWFSWLWRYVNGFDLLSTSDTASENLLEALQSLLWCGWFVIKREHGGCVGVGVGVGMGVGV